MPAAAQTLRKSLEEEARAQYDSKQADSNAVLKTLEGKGGNPKDAAGGIGGDAARGPAASKLGPGGGALTKPDPSAAKAATDFGKTLAEKAVPPTQPAEATDGGKGAEGGDGGMGSGPAAPPSAGGGAPPSAGAGPSTAAGKKTREILKKKPSDHIASFKTAGSAIAAAKKTDEAKAHAALPEVRAVMPGDAQAAAKNKHLNPKSDASLGDGKQGPDLASVTPEPEPTATTKPQNVSGMAKSELQNAEAFLDQLKALLGSIMSSISTTSAQNTSPGNAPTTKFQGSADPNRASRQEAEASSKIDAAHAANVQAIDDGKGPDDIHRKELDQEFTFEKLPEFKLAEEAVSANMKEYEGLEINADERAKADDILVSEKGYSDHQAKADKDVQAAIEKQAKDNEEATKKAQADIAKQNADAEKQQEDLVAKHKGEIDKAQKDTKAKQKAEVKKAKRKGDKERKRVEGDISVRKKKDDAKIESEYKGAEKKAKSEKKKAEAKAAAKKREAKAKEKKKSWWDRVKSAVSDFVESVCKAIGSIFDALGKLVSGILNAVKKLASAIIDEAMKWAKKALDGLGGLLKGLVSGLLGGIFPGLAKQLNGLIDSGIDLCKKGVDQIGEGVKKGVEAAVDGVNKVAQKGLQVAKVGMQTGLRVAGSLATGDLEGAFLAGFYGACEIAGVSRADAETMLGNAKDTIKLVVDDPGAFVGNLIGAGVKGFQDFGSNFLKHLTGGIKTWLLGPVAASGLKAPDTWDAKGIFGMVMGILGVSGESLKEMAAERIGQSNMDMLEKAYGYVETFLTGGFSGLWDHIQGNLSDLWDVVKGSVIEFVTQKVATVAIEKIITIFAGPFGAVWEAIKTGYSIYCTVRDKINEIKEVFTAIFSSIGDIARGNIGKAASWVEGALAKVLGVAITFLANWLNMGDLPQKIRGFIEGVQTKVKKSIGKAMDWVVEKVKGVFKGGKGKKEEDGKSKPKEEGPKFPAPVTFKAGDHGHKVFVDATAQQPKLMVASTPMKITDKIADWRKVLKDKSKDDKKKAGGLIGKAVAIDKKGGDIAAKIRLGTATDAELKAQMDQIKPVLAELFMIMEPAPTEWDCARDDPFKHPAWEAFKLRAGGMNPPMSEAQATKLWKDVLDATGESYAAAAKAKAGGAANEDLAKKMKASARGKFKAIADQLLADGRYDMLKGKKYALWSGGAITHQFASKQGFTVLETTEAGKLFDNLKILEGPDAWPSLEPLWQEISRGYASKIQLGEIDAFQRWQGGIFKGVEKPTVEARLRKSKSKDKLKWKYHAIVAKGKLARDDENVKLGLGKVVFNDLQDAGVSPDEAGWAATIKAHEDKVREEVGGGVPTDSKTFFAAPKIKAGLDKMHFKARDMAKGSITSRLSTFLPNYTDWAAVKTALSTKGAIKDAIDKPASAHDYGLHVVANQAPAAAKKAAETFDNPAKKLDGTSPEAYAKKKVTTLNNASEFQKGRTRLREQIFDKSKSGTVATALTAGFKEVMKKGGGTHTEFEIVWRGPDKARADGGKEFDYRTKAGATFTVVMDKSSMIKSVEGHSLTLKPDALKGLRGRTDSSGYNRVGGAPLKTGIDASHLIADEFGGCGYAKGCNLVAASQNFNRKVMRKQEKLIAKWINKLGATEFSLKTSVDWAKLTEAKVMAAMKAQHSKALAGVPDKDKALKDHMAAFQKKYKDQLSKNLQRVWEVTYTVGAKDALGKGHTKTFLTGPDLWLMTEF